MKFLPKSCYCESPSEYFDPSNKVEIVPGEAPSLPWALVDLRCQVADGQTQVLTSSRSHWLVSY